ncbi:MAG: hypothetical protein HGA44_14530 [Cellulomonadaceae bacterium]|nr:hypothetical protein [Cellulomonadaceae bacterium]
MTFHVLQADRRQSMAHPLHDRPAALTVLLPPGGPIDDDLGLAWTWTGENEPPDLVRTVDRIRVFSARTREVIDAHLGRADQVQWLPCELQVGGNTADGGWAVPHFPVVFDVLSEELTTWGPSGLPIRWVLSKNKCQGHSVFALHGVQGQTIVAEPLLAALLEAGITGIAAEPARVDR